jgi:hypothetical protein
MAGGKFEQWFRFESDQFDQSSELPEDYNAGNRFYGRDVAAFITEGLVARGLTADFVGEDWGWFVGARYGDDVRLQIAIYAGLDGEPGSGEWAFMVRQLERRRWLGFIPIPAESEVDEHVITTIVDVFGAVGMELHQGAPQGQAAPG